MRIQHRVRASHVSPWDRAPFLAFDPDEQDYGDIGWSGPRDEREVPVPFENVCPDCSGYKHPDNAVCDDCNDKIGVEDHQ